MTEQESHKPDTGMPRLFYGYYIVVIALFIMLFVYGSRTVYGIFFKPMMLDFEWSRGATSLAITLSMLVQGLWGIVMGKLNDRKGPRLIISLCCFLVGAGFLLLSQVEHLWQLYIFYGLVVGMGMGGVFVVILSTVSRWFVKKRGTMTGIVLAGLGASMLLMSPTANWLIDVFGWRVSYAVVGAVILVVGITLAQFLKRDPSTMGLTPLGMKESGSPDTPVSVYGLTLREAMATWQFWVVVVCYVCFGYNLFTLTVHTVPLVTDIGISPTMAATILVFLGVGNILGGLVIGILADRIGNIKAFFLCFLLMAVPVFLIISSVHAWQFCLLCVIFGLGVGGGGTLEPTIVAELFGIRWHGLILGVVSFTFTVGGAIGPLVTGVLFDIYGDYRVALIISGCLCVLALGLTAVLKPVKKMDLSAR